MRDQMLGVVLWANARATTALIWCEDHGDLALYEDDSVSAHSGEGLDAGDLIEFEVAPDPGARMRRAANLRCVDKGFAPGLAEELRGSMAAEMKGQAPVSLRPRMRPAPQERGSNVVQFPGILACA